MFNLKAKFNWVYAVIVVVIILLVITNVFTAYFLYQRYQDTKQAKIKVAEELENIVDELKDSEDLVGDIDTISVSPEDQILVEWNELPLKVSPQTFFTEMV